MIIPRTLTIITACFATLAAAQERNPDLHSDGGAWQFHPAKGGEELPRVLLIGDSIMNGYRGRVVAGLKGRAAVDCWLTPLHLASKDLHHDLRKVLEQGPYQVVHFNIGLHGWTPGRIPEGQYEPLLKAYVDIIQKHSPDAKPVWASSTQITVKGKPTELEPIHNQTIVNRNAIAARVMAARKIPVNDLYGLMSDQLNLARGDRFHWKGEGYELMAKQILSHIEPLLPAATPSVWNTRAPRTEISPGFRHQNGVFVIEDKADNPGVQGHWETTIPVQGGKHHRFSVLRRASESIEHPRRSCVVRIEWQNGEGGSVTSPVQVNPSYFGKASDLARPEFPRDQGSPDAEGWVAVGDTWQAPEDATQAMVKLQLRWAPDGKVEWKNPKLETVAPPKPRRVTLAAIHLNVSGNHTAQRNCEAFAPLIAEAAEKAADLVVLPEFLPCKGVTNDYAKAAEPVPGPSSNYFASLARKHDLYIVFSLAERNGPLIHNTAVLLAPDGKLAGKYRKVTLPREEIERGITPGHEYPVFDTRFGKLGMMICYDVFFPEVARELAFNGAEVIALPIWGGNPLLASARCAENGVFLVTSTYTSHQHDWMKTAIWNREGGRIAEATEWGQIVTAEIDLAQRTYWSHIGDFQARIAREAPVRKAE